ncbi:MAG: hypothetical protein J4G17_13275, partial [Anaerolineae bacterium]|nr:hypothetical protein [Anaerolineae bacterium]
THIQGGPYPRMCLAPHSRWLVYTGERSLHAVQLDSLEERTLIADTGAWELGYPSVSADESSVILPLSTLHPEIAAGTRVTRHYFDHFADGRGMQLRWRGERWLTSGARTVAAVFMRNIRRRTKTWCCWTAIFRRVTGAAVTAARHVSGPCNRKEKR